MRFFIVLSFLFSAGCSFLPKQNAKMDPLFYSEKVEDGFTKPLIYSNANGMVLEKHIPENKRKAMLNNGLKAFGNGKRCFQHTISSSGFTDYKKFHESESLSDDSWIYEVTNGTGKIVLKCISDEAIVKMNEIHLI